MPEDARHSDGQAFNEEREWMCSVLSSDRDGIAVTNADGNITHLNSIAQSLTGWSQEEAFGVPLRNVLPFIRLDSRRLVENPDVRPPGEHLGNAKQWRLVARDSTEHTIDCTAALIGNAAGEMDAVVLVFRDATKELPWRKSEVQYRRLFESARDGILILDEKTGKIIDANPFMSDLLGYEHRHFLGKELWEIGLFKDIEANQKAFLELQKKGYLRYDHLPLETRDKRTVDVEVVSNAYEADGRLVIQCNIRDCTERCRLQQIVQASLQEKKVLLKEIHHRVKNNLQIISSLLQLQSDHLKDPASFQMFRESCDRVRSMALVHEHLYRSADLAQLDFTEYIEILAFHLLKSHVVDTERIELIVNVQSIRLSIDVAVPIGLLVNELISNCLKHAFRVRDRGHIWIDLRPFDGTEVLLSVRDDGVGMPSGIDLQSGETFGMELITDLVAQLHGQVQFLQDSGTTVRIIFRASHANAAGEITTK